MKILKTELIAHKPMTIIIKIEFDEIHMAAAVDRDSLLENEQKIYLILFKMNDDMCQIGCIDNLLFNLQFACSLLSHKSDFDCMIFQILFFFFLTFLSLSFQFEQYTARYSPINYSFKIK